MKITRVEAIHLRLPDVNERCDGSQDTLVVKVHTDANITGIGEVDSSPAVAKAIVEAPVSHKICRGLAECVMGQDPFEIDRLAHRMYEGTICFGRQGAGAGIELMVDAGLCWDTATAIRRSRQFEPFGLTWLEEPLHPDNVQGYGKLSAQSPIRIAAGEEVCDVAEFRTLMDVGGIDVAQVDVTRVGGLSRSKRIGWDSVERHRLCVNHSYKTGINIAASLHFVAALPNTQYFEYCVEAGALRKSLTKQTFPVVEGDISVPEEPGLGVDLD